MRVCVLVSDVSLLIEPASLRMPPSGCLIRPVSPYVATDNYVENGHRGGCLLICSLETTVFVKRRPLWTAGPEFRKFVSVPIRPVERDPLPPGARPQSEPL
jgi:hypothetical protein